MTAAETRVAGGTSAGGAGGRGVADGAEAERLLARAEADFPRYEVVKDLVDELIDLQLDDRQSGHPGGSRSKVHMLLTLLLSGAMRWDIRRPWLRYGDRFVLSAGHTVPLVYATLAVLNESLRARFERTGDPRFAFPDDGRFALTWEQLPELRHRGGLPGHAEMAGRTLFFKANTGPSGHGMPFAAGEALALKLAGAGEVRVFVVEGEGGLTPGAAHETKNSAWGLGLSNLVFLIDWNDFGIDERPASAVVHGTPVDWFEPYGWRVTGAERGMEWDSVMPAVVDAARGPNADGVPSVAWFRTRKGRGYGKLDAASHGAPHKQHAPEFWAVRREFMARYGVAYQGVGEAAPADAAARAAEARANFGAAIDVLRRDEALVDWLSDRLLEIAGTVPDEIEGARAGRKKPAAAAPDVARVDAVGPIGGVVPSRGRFGSDPISPACDHRIFDFERYPAEMWRAPGDLQPNRAALGTWGSYVNAVARRDYGRPLFIACSADLAEINQHRRLRQAVRGSAGFRLVRARLEPDRSAPAHRDHRVRQRRHDGRAGQCQLRPRPLCGLRRHVGRLLDVRLVQLPQVRPASALQPAGPGLRPAPRQGPVRRRPLRTGDGRGFTNPLRDLRAGRHPALPGRPRDRPAPLGVQRGARGPGRGLRHGRADHRLAPDQAAGRSA